MPLPCHIAILSNLAYFVFSVQYIIYMYCYLKEWRKNPKWSLSCCLALLLPLNELQGEIRGLAGTNVLKQQIQTGKINMPSITSTLKDSGIVNFTLEEEPDSNLAGNGESIPIPSSKEDGGCSSRGSSESHADITVVRVHTTKPTKSYDTAL